MSAQLFGRYPALVPPMKNGNCLSELNILRRQLCYVRSQNWFEKLVTHTVVGEADIQWDSTIGSRTTKSNRMKKCQKTWPIPPCSYLSERQLFGDILQPLRRILEISFSRR